MAAFTELLEPTKTHTHRCVRWEPCPADARCACSGVLTVETRKATDRYAVTEFPLFAFGGRAFRLTKPSGAGVYNVRVGERPADLECDCAGFTYGGGRRLCKHIDAVVALLANGWLPHPLENGEQDTGATEVD